MTPKSIWSGSFFIGGIELHCHVLDNGKRIIEAQDVDALFNAMGLESFELKEDSLQEFIRWMRSLEVTCK